MKKIVALVLALMMVLSLGVSALALTKIDLDQVEVTEDGTKLIKFVDTVEFIGADKVLYTNAAALVEGLLEEHIALNGNHR